MIAVKITIGKAEKRRWDAPIPSRHQDAIPVGFETVVVSRATLYSYLEPEGSPGRRAG